MTFKVSDSFDLYLAFGDPGIKPPPDARTRLRAEGRIGKHSACIFMNLEKHTDEDFDCFEKMIFQSTNEISIRIYVRSLRPFPFFVNYR